MEIILVKTFKKLGKAGQLVKVKSGYARNFLLPANIAMLATKENKKRLDELQKEFEYKNSSLLQEVTKQYDCINSQEIIFIEKASEDGKLFGSVNAKQIANRINKSYDLKIQNNQVHINCLIKSLGVYEVSIVLHAEMIAKVLINVASADANAASQMQAFKSSIV